MRTREDASAEGGTFGWWFARQPVERGDVRVHSGALIPGRSGLHAATTPLGALPYAKSGRLCRVSLHGGVVEVDGQRAAEYRRVEYVVDAAPVLRGLATAWVARLLGAPLAERAAHVAAARAARERVIAQEERIRDARWVLEGGARDRTPHERATAEGRLAGAIRAAAEARRDAEAHEAAAALLEGDDVRALARATDRATRAFAALEPGDLDRALVEVRARLDAEVIAAVETLAPKEPLPPFSLESPRESASESTPPVAPGPSAGAPRGPHPAPTPTGDVDGGEGRDEDPSIPIDPLIVTAPPPLEDPTPSAVQFVQALRRALDPDPAFVSLHQGWDAGPVFVVRRSRSLGAAELMDRIVLAPALAGARVRFVVCWDAPSADGGGWAIEASAARPLPEPTRGADEVLAIRRTPPVDLDRVETLLLELLLSSHVHRYWWTEDDGGDVLVLDLQGRGSHCSVSDGASVLARVQRAGVRRAVAVSRSIFAPAVSRFALQTRETGLAGLSVRDALREGAPSVVELWRARLGHRSEPREAPGGAVRARLHATLRDGPPYHSIQALRSRDVHFGQRLAYVVLTDAEHIDAITVRLARSLPVNAPLTVFVLPVDDPAAALDEGSAGVVSPQPWLERPLDDPTLVDAVFEAMERPPEVLDSASVAALLEPLAVTAADLSSVSVLGVAHIPESERTVIAVWIVDAFTEQRVRETLESSAPGLPFVFVVGASRLTPGLEPHVITPNRAAEAAVRDVGVSALARALYRALVGDPFYSKRHSRF